MKKSLFILATAALVFASCNNDVKIDENKTLDDANEISFRPEVKYPLRAADVTQTWMQTGSNGFYVTARYHEEEAGVESATYFDGAHYIYNSTTSSYTCADKYYWPNAGYLNFYAWAPAAGTDIAKTDYKTFVVTPNQTASTNAQQDFVYANTANQNKANNVAGVTLQFHHAESKILLQAKNSSATMDITITGNISLCNVKRQGTFTFTGLSDSKLKFADWGSLGDAGNYEQEAGTTTFNANATAASIANELILIPQAVAPVTQYASAAVDAALSTTGSYIKIPISIKQKGTSIVIFTGDAIWPLPVGTWNPGYKYTYTVDLAGGGYSPTSKDADIDLDPNIEGAEIIFVTVNVDNWSDGGETVINNQTYAKGGTYNVNLPNAAAGVYYITITGLTAAETITCTGTNNFTASPTVTPSATVGASGSVTIVGTLTANSSASVTSVVTVTGSTSGATTINLIQAAE